ncbi:hypothetical protein FHY05_003896 [Sphingomonas sp. BK580]|nr:hypothetical protein [Sphingomonas sp. BK580]
MASPRVDYLAPARCGSKVQQAGKILPRGKFTLLPLGLSGTHGIEADVVTFTSTF